MLDEFYLYNKALSHSHISKMSQVCDFRRIVLYFGFTLVEGLKIIDQSGLSNNGLFSNQSELYDGICGQGVNFTNPVFISLDGNVFRQKPIMAISISTWLRLNTNRSTLVFSFDLLSYSLC